MGHPSAAAWSGRPFRIAAAASALAVLLLLLALQPQAPQPLSTPGFLKAALGAPQPSAPLVRTPAPGVRVAVRDGGYAVERGKASVSVVSAEPGDAPWVRFEGGVTRPTAFGHETVTIDGAKAEQLLTVTERQGPRTWRWNLAAPGLTPVLRADGGVDFRRGSRTAGIAIRPVAILDGAGRDITPAGTRWSLERSGDAWTLALRLDDTRLPVPYVIDPAVDYPSPLYLSSTNGSITGTTDWQLKAAQPSAANLSTKNDPGKNGVGYVQFAPGAATTTLAAPALNSKGWFVDAGASNGNTGFPTGAWSFTLKTDVEGTSTGGTAVLTVAMWKGTISAGVFGTTTQLIAPTDDPGAVNIVASATPVTRTVTIPSVPKFRLNAGETLLVQVWRHQTVGYSSNNAANRTVDLSVNDGVSLLTPQPADDGAPVNALSITSASGAYLSGGTLFYKGNAAGSFAFRDTLTDTAGTGTASGPHQVQYPAVSTTGWTHALETVTTGPSFQSSTYSWTASPSNPAVQTLTGEDKALGTATAAVTFQSDTAAPATTDDTATIGSAWRNTDQTVTLTPADGAGSGTAATYSTTDGSAPTTGSPQGTSVPLTADGVYTVKYFSTDRVGNAEAVKTAGTQIRIDKTAPASATLDALPASIRNGQALTGSSADGGPSGIASVAYYRCAGAPCTPSTLIGTSSTGPDYSVAWSAQPADGVYQVLARAQDAAGNTLDSAKQTVTIDNTAPAAPSIASTPSDPTNSTAPAFGFTGEASATFACELDGAGFTACTSPKSYAGLLQGAHTFKVKQTDAAGNPGPSATFAWTIDTTDPGAPSIGSAPADPTNSTAPGFSFTGEASATFACQLDGAGYTACTSPRSYSGLAQGVHTFDVRQTDLAGNTGSPATVTWTIDTTAPAAPAITSTPPDPTNSGAPSFVFTGEASATFACELDGAGFTGCTSPKSYAGLTQGSHTFKVKQTDAAGNPGPTATFTWTIDTTAPAAPSISSGPSDPSNLTGASFSFSGEASATPSCELDGGGFSPCTSPKTLHGPGAGRSYVPRPADGRRRQHRTRRRLRLDDRHDRAGVAHAHLGPLRPDQLDGRELRLHGRARP